MFLQRLFFNSVFGCCSCCHSDFLSLEVGMFCLFFFCQKKHNGRFACLDLVLFFVVSILFVCLIEFVFFCFVLP